MVAVRGGAVADVTPVSSKPARVKVPTVLQQAATECGAASLAMILAHYGCWVTLDKLRDDCGVDRNGASAQAVADAAESYGLSYEGLSLTTEELDGVSVPAIIWWKRCHFMVLEGASGGRFFVNDPARGRYTMSREEFAAGYSGITLTLSQTESFTKQGQPFRTGSSLWSRMKSSRAGVNFAIIAGVFGTFLALIIAPVNQVFINGALGLDHRSVLPVLIGVLFAIGVLRLALNLLQYGVLARLQAKFTLVGTTGLIERLVRLPMIFYLERTTGDLSQRIGYNSTVAQLLASQMASAGIALISIIGFAALLIYYNWIIGLIVVALAILNVVALHLVQRSRTDAQRRILQRQNHLRGLTTASIRNIETLKSTGREDETFADLAAQQADYISASAALVPSSALLASLPSSLMALTSAAILVVGGIFVIHGSFTLGALLAMQALAVNLNSPIQTLMGTGSQLQTITADLQALDDVMSNEIDQRFTRPHASDDDDAANFSGRLSIQGVSFGYGPKGPLVIENFSLDLQPGRRVALVGRSGAGKSTIGNLAANLFEPRSGQVLFDGRPLSDFPDGTLESCVAKVDQLIVLFEGTVRDNITLWDPSIETHDVREALADAQILDDVLARAGGLDALVEEDGRNFSGGQAQRLEIARALVRRPRLLILDEATSALDDVTEKAVDDAIRRRGLATLVIAHRLSTIRDADEIIVLGRGGALLERGTHSELIAKDGEYASMVADAGEGGDVGS